MIKITSCQEYDSGHENEGYRIFAVTGMANGKSFSVAIIPFSGEYDYDQYPEGFGDDDEQILVAIGRYFLDNNIDIGIVGR